MNIKNQKKQCYYVVVNEGESAADFCGKCGRATGRLLRDDYLTLHKVRVEVAAVGERAGLVERELQRTRRSTGDGLRVGDVVIAGIVAPVLAGGAHVVDGRPLVR